MLSAIDPAIAGRRFARSAGTRIHYEVHGEERPEQIPVLLVMGLGMAATGWWRTTATLAPSLRTLAFDNRGAGRSDAPPGPYATAAMAADALAVLDAAEVERAHVYGLSLGGMVAQELALAHPHRVERLVLGATSAGGAAATPADEAVQRFFERRTEMPFEEAAWASVPYLYGPATVSRYGGRIGQDMEQRLRFPIEPEPYRAQLAAAIAHDAADRLGTIRAPTLVVHGAADRMIPPANGRRLAELIPHAELHICPGAGHLYTTDAPAVDRRILRFLLGGHEARAPAAAAR